MAEKVVGIGFMAKLVGQQMGKFLMKIALLLLALVGLGLDRFLSLVIRVKKPSRLVQIEGHLKNMDGLSISVWAYSNSLNGQKKELLK